VKLRGGYEAGENICAIPQNERGIDFTGREYPGGKNEKNQREEERPCLERRDLKGFLGLITEGGS